MESHDRTALLPINIVTIMCLFLEVTVTVIWTIPGNPYDPLLTISWKSQINTRTLSINKISNGYPIRLLTKFVRFTFKKYPMKMVDGYLMGFKRGTQFLSQFSSLLDGSLLIFRATDPLETILFPFFYSLSRFLEWHLVPRFCHYSFRKVPLFI